MMGELFFEDIFTEENIEEALRFLETKYDSCGMDGLYLSHLREYWKINGQDILEMLGAERYNPVPVRNTVIVNKKGKRRTISLFSSLDRLILRCMALKLSEQYDSLLDEHCFAFRKDLGMESAVRAASDYLDQGKLWCAKIDIQNYYDSIPISLLETDIEEVISDAKIRRLIGKYLHIRVEDDGNLHQKMTGIITGSPISPFLSNLYLRKFDEHLSAEGICFCRFCDDIAAFFETHDEAVSFEQSAAEELRQIYCLEINRQKSGVYEGLRQKFLGYTFSRDKQSGKVLAYRRQKPSELHYSSWNQEGVKKVDGSYHLINSGTLSRKDFSILFENEEGKKYIPVETTDALNVYSNIIFTSEFFRFMAQKKINVNIFDKYGNCIGYFCASDNGFMGRTMLRQAQLYLDKKRRTQVARTIEIASLKNIRSNLKYYQRHVTSESLDSAITSFSQMITEMNQAKTIDEMMLLEGRARQVYYRQFNEIIHGDQFRFTVRTRRPPKDALNAMISFGNTYLYNRIATEIRKTTLDIRIGFVHATTTRSQSLNLDIADLFKPVIVDRAIFTLINKHMLNEQDHFEKVETDGTAGVYLNGQGKRIFIRELDNKIYQKKTIRNETLSYDTRIKREISAVFRMVVHDEKYKPFSC